MDGGFRGRPGIHSGRLRLLGGRRRLRTRSPDQSNHVPIGRSVTITCTLQERIGTTNAAFAGAAGVGAVRPPREPPAAGLKRRVRGGEGEGRRQARPLALSDPPPPATPPYTFQAIIACLVHFSSAAGAVSVLAAIRDSGGRSLTDDFVQLLEVGPRDAGRWLIAPIELRVSEVGVYWLEVSIDGEQAARTPIHVRAGT